MTEPEHFLENCLFFNINTLSRYLLKLAQHEFDDLNISPAHASLMLIVYDNPGISPKKLSQMLHLTPSTISRFIDALIKKGLLIRKSKGKLAFIYPSKKGLLIKPDIADSYFRLYKSYTDILGEKEALQLSQLVLKQNQSISQAMKKNDRKF